MYWLLDYEEQDRIREVVLKLHDSLAAPHRRVQEDQTFPFVGRKDRGIASTIIESLTSNDGVVCDPFAGSGTFVYSALDCRRKVKANEWEPYAHELMTAPFSALPTKTEFEEALSSFKDRVLPTMEQIYETICPECGNTFMFDGLFFDRDPEEYFHPTPHERLGKNSRENVIFRGKYKCPNCGRKEKNYDDHDEVVRKRLDGMTVAFPDTPIIENSRLNFTAPDFTHYGALFSKRQKSLFRPFIRLFRKSKALLASSFMILFCPLSI